MLRRLMTLVLAALVLGGAYAVTFGLPASVSAMVKAGRDPAATAETAGAAANPAGQAPATQTPATQTPATQAPGRAGGGGRGPGGAARVTTVVTAPLERQPYESILSAIGTASALRSVTVMTETAGTVLEANLSANREVKAGEVLVRFDAKTQELNLLIAQTQLGQANETVARYEQLRQTGNTTVPDVTLSEAIVQQRLAEAAVGLAEIALEDRTIRAPIAGRLGLSDVGVGDALAANSVIATVDQSDALLIEFELPERAIGLLANAKEVLASTSTFTGRVFTARIVAFDSRIDSVTRSVTVKAQIDNADGLLWPGMTFAVRLTQQSDPLPALPSTAITWSRSGSSVWIDKDGTAEQVPVTILFRQNETVWIDADLAEGTMVVTEGALKLRAGAKIATPGGGRAVGRAPAEGAAPSRGQGSGDQPQTTPKEPT